MKVGELEAFESAINDKLLEKSGTNKLQMTFEEALFLLSKEELSQLSQYIERKIQLKRLLKNQFNENSFTTQIA
jgi:hypothetical protein